MLILNSRSTVSVTLKTLIRLNIIQVIKKTKDRKKYYQITFGLKQNLFNTLNRFRYIFSHAKEIIRKQFIPDMERIQEDSKEIQKMKEFFDENIRFFELFEEYTYACNDVLDELIPESKPTNF